MSAEYLDHHVQQASEGKAQCNYCYVCNIRTNTLKHWEAVHETGTEIQFQQKTLLIKPFFEVNN